MKNYPKKQSLLLTARIKKEWRQMDKFEVQDILNLLERSFKKLYHDDSFLINSSANEISICHRLAMYLERELPFKYKVDIEYNRDKSNVKKSTNNKIIYQDIVVHQRNNDNNNIIHFEVKKKKIFKKDIEKVVESINDRNYQYGIVIYKIAVNKLCFRLFYDKLIEKDYSFDGTKINEICQ